MIHDNVHFFFSSKAQKTLDVLLETSLHNSDMYNFGGHLGVIKVSPLHDIKELALVAPATITIHLTYFVLELSHSNAFHIATDDKSSGTHCLRSFQRQLSTFGRGKGCLGRSYLQCRIRGHHFAQKLRDQYL